MANYGQFKHASIKGEKGTDWLIHIFKKDYANLVDDYTFLDASGGDWNLPSNASFDSGGGLNITSSGSSGIISQDLGAALVDGKTYYVTVKVSSYSGSSAITPSIGGAGGSSITSNGIHQQTIVAGSADNNLAIVVGALFAGKIDYVIISADSTWAGSSEMTLSGEGFQITWNGQGGTRDRVFLGSECVLSFFVENQTDEDWLYNDVFIKGDKYHFIRIYKNSVTNDNLWWFGYFQPAFDKFENTPFPYVTQLTATDSYGFYSKLKKSSFASEASKNTPHKIKTILLNIGSKMSLANTSTDDDTPVPVLRNWLRTSIDWWRPEDTYQSSDPFNLYKASKGAFAPRTEFDENDNITNLDEALKYKDSEVFDGCLKTFNTVGFLAEGYYYFIQPNSLANNTTATLKTWQYRDESIGGVDVGNITPLLTIDQSNNVILGGSNLIYEPSLESVTTNYTLGDSTFFISPGADLTTSFVAGGIQVATNTDDYFTLDFHAIHRETITTSDFSFSTFNPTPSINVPATVRNSSFLTTATLIISITDGSTTKYLQPSPSPISSTSNNLIWTTSGSPLSITIKRGYNAYGGLSSVYAIGDVSNYIVESGGLIQDDSFGPCSRNIYPNDSTPNYKFRTDIYFSANVDAPGIQGNVSVQVTAVNDYSQVYESGSAPFYTLDTYSINALNDPTPTSTSTTCGNISLYFSGNSEYADTASEYEYSANQTQIPSNESISLGKIKLGSSNLNELYSIQYVNSSGVNTPAMLFQRGNPTPDDGKNITQLLVNEFLSLQIEPLEILQADIQSADISPLKLIKYSINNNSSYKYYVFMGGTFSAQSEIMRGEWYKVNSQIDYVTEPEPTPTEIFAGKNVIANNNIYNEIPFSTNQTIIQKLLDESYGVLNADLTTSSSTNKLVLSSNSKGKIYDNQKIRISFPDGSNSTILISDGDNLTSSSQINIDSFTPRMIYPSGSIVTPLTYDLTNVITGGGSTSPAGSDTQVQFNNSGSFGASAELTWDGTSLTSTRLVADDTDESPTAIIQLMDGTGNGIAQLARIGSGANAHRGQLILRDSATAKVQIKASGSSYINSSSAKLGIGNSSPTAELDVTGDVVISGSLTADSIVYTEVRILPSDFIADDVGRPLMIDDSTGDRWLKSHSTAKMYASVQIPKGRTATQLIIYGSGTSAVTVYEATIDSDTVTSKGTGNIGSVVNFTDVTHSSGNYLLIELAQTSTEKVYGGKVTIT
jgi:hypothetical protein